MLGKLMKYEWKATWKLLAPLNLFIVLTSILAYITVQLSFFDTDSNLVILTGTMIMTTYILSMIVVSIGTTIYLIYRFYTSVYGDEGYLLHTLPVDKHHIIIAKVLVSVSWLLINAALIYVSIIVLFSTQRAFVDAMVDSFEFYVEIANDAGIELIGGFDVLMTLIASLAAVIARILKVTASVSLGQLAPNHKVLSAFGIYCGLYFVQNIFSVFYSIMVMVRALGKPDDLFWLFSSSWEFNLISSLLYCVLFYFLTWYVMEKKLNLD
ncbi:MAG: hypothetical protein NC314_11225 [Roseburia sp.]|nr:hypothetical protein [Ruminococcus sp.]MCM1153800.1 hypothetical protein [Roseburia sp.]MCM1243403.1 hypothetical protein [Roseburia sp.]